LGLITGERRLHINSLHHQGVTGVSSELKLLSVAPYGLTQVVELRGHPFGLSVQWHKIWLADQLYTRVLFKQLLLMKVIDLEKETASSNRCRITLWRR